MPGLQEPEGYKEMSSIFADQKRPRIRVQMGGGGGEVLRGHSQFVQLLTTGEMEPK
jgi:hypothetical protein